MYGREIAPGVRALGAVDWDNRLFDSLIPLPDGTSYNSFLVEGSERTALVDTVEPSHADGFLAQLSKVPRLDYLVSLHAEQDHSGSIPAVLARFPAAQVLCSAKAVPMLESLLGVDPARLRAVADGEEVSLGDRTLRFIATPWMHWPETFSAFLPDAGVLFTCDLFGSHLATSEICCGGDAARVHEAAKRYYAEILMPFRKLVRKNVEKVRALPVRLIAPSHGPAHDRPESILAAYEEWTSDTPKNRAVVAFVSMHQSTRALADRLVEALVTRGVGVERLNLAVTDVGKLAMSLVDAGSIVLGTPTVLNGPHPSAVYAACLVNALKPRAVCAAIVGSYGWKGRAAEVLQSLMPDLEAEWLPPVLSQGLPRPADLAAVDALADAIAARHRARAL